MQIIQRLLTPISSFFIALFMAFSINAAPVDTYEFPDPVTKKRFQQLVYELRCPKCQNQNLADSNSMIAVDLRKQVYDMLIDGRSDMEIVNFMVERYGDYVLYRPKVSAATYLLWFGPIGFIVIGGIVIALFVRQSKEQSQPLSDEQKQQLNEILKD
ncbi:cytochrome c-type biogenesis protein CcmH [Thalassotalea litorea]|uniref:Cytochrome c-type biogenesis protein n=2 Tax=Thalassotalea litorea TaxID=2020715 RepID=A0A5R9ISL8_9GAMM|nr:cytochrome c-type biogenesis protein CcmH [Thalassotalea litorea]